MPRKKAKRATGSPSSSSAFELKRTVPAIPATVERVLEDIMRAVYAHRWPCGDADEIRLAVREALNNAVRHGSHLDPRKHVHVTCRFQPQEGLSIIVRDEGSGFDPQKVPDPTEPQNLERFSGRGLYMMQELMDEVEYRDGGREVHLRRRCRPRG